MLGFMTGLLGAVDPSVNAATTAVSSWVTDNGTAILGVVLVLAGLSFAIGFIYTKIRRAKSA
jgi:hypothetical protein